MTPSGNSRDRRRSTGGLRRASDQERHEHRKRSVSAAGGSRSFRAPRCSRPPWDVRAGIIKLLSIEDDEPLANLTMIGVPLDSQHLAPLMSVKTLEVHTLMEAPLACWSQERTRRHEQEWALTPFELVCLFPSLAQVPMTFADLLILQNKTRWPGHLDIGVAWCTPTAEMFKRLRLSVYKRQYGMQEQKLAARISPNHARFAPQQHPPSTRQHAISRGGPNICCFHEFIMQG